VNNELVQITKLAIEGAWIAQSPVLTDNRGYFREWFRLEEVSPNLGHSFSVKQANMSSSKRGVVRGIHYSLISEGQSKWVTCVSGLIWDVIVDLRPNSPTFKSWVGVYLSPSSGDSLFISEGLGHGFVSLEENSDVVYLLSSAYSPSHEFEIHPFDPDIGIEWPISEITLSNKDSEAPSLRQQLESGNL
jgi:dTDP-4-dehydrorhamnose 3,5-epimerase